MSPFNYLLAGKRERLGWISAALGVNSQLKERNLDAVKDRYSETLRIALDQNNELQTISLTLLGSTMIKTDESEQAEEYLQKAIDMIMRSDNHLLAIGPLRMLGCLVLDDNGWDILSCVG